MKWEWWVNGVMVLQNWQAARIVSERCALSHLSTSLSLDFCTNQSTQIVVLVAVRFRFCIHVWECSCNHLCKPETDEALTPREVGIRTGVDHWQLGLTNWTYPGDFTHSPNAFPEGGMAIFLEMGTSACLVLVYVFCFLCFHHGERQLHRLCGNHQKAVLCMVLVTSTRHILEKSEWWNSKTFTCWSGSRFFDVNGNLEDTTHPSRQNLYDEVLKHQAMHIWHQRNSWIFLWHSPRDYWSAIYKFLQVCDFTSMHFSTRCILKSIKKSENPSNHLPQFCLPWWDLYHFPLLIHYSQ